MLEQVPINYGLTTSITSSHIFLTHDSTLIMLIHLKQQSYNYWDFFYLLPPSMCYALNQEILIIDFTVVEWSVSKTYVLQYTQYVTVMLLHHSEKLFIPTVTNMTRSTKITSNQKWHMLWERQSSWMSLSLIKYMEILCVPQ